MKFAFCHRSDFHSTSKGRVLQFPRLLPIQRFLISKTNTESNLVGSFNSARYKDTIPLRENGKFCISEPDTEPNWVGSFGSARYSRRYVATLPISCQLHYQPPSLAQALHADVLQRWQVPQAGSGTQGQSGMGLFNNFETTLKTLQSLSKDFSQVPRMTG